MGGTSVGRNNSVVKKLCTVLTRWNTLEGDAERVRQQLRGRRERRGEMTEVVLERPGGEQSLRCLTMLWGLTFGFGPLVRDCVSV